MEAGELRDLIDSVTAPSAAALEGEEARLRVSMTSRLFMAFGCDDRDRVRVYVEETAAIPLGFLALAVRSILRSRKYSSVPAIGELWTLARAAAGMDRQQYRAGRYCSPPRDWPPDGQRHAVNAGELEALPETTRNVIAALGAPSAHAAKRLADGA